MIFFGVIGMLTVGPPSPGEVPIGNVTTIPRPTEVPIPGVTSIITPDSTPTTILPTPTSYPELTQLSRSTIFQPGGVGSSVAIDEDVMLIGEFDTRKVHFFRRNEANEWQEEATLESDVDGFVVGGYMAVDGNVASAGGRIFEYTDSQWQEVPLEPYDHWLPLSKVLVEDDQVIFIAHSGVAQVFMRNENGTWTPTQELSFRSADGPAYAFDADVDGDSMIVAYSGSEFAVAAHWLVFYQRVGAEWKLVSEMKFANKISFARYGDTLAMCEHKPDGANEIQFLRDTSPEIRDWTTVEQSEVKLPYLYDITYIDEFTPRIYMTMAEDRLLFYGVPERQQDAFLLVFRHDGVVPSDWHWYETLHPAGVFFPRFENRIALSGRTVALITYDATTFMYELTD
jgi:hypothetical protein